MRIAVAQIASEPDDLRANVATHAKLIRDARGQGARVVVFPELSLTGYDLEAVGRDPQLTIARDDDRLRPLTDACRESGAVAVVGAPVSDDGKRLLGALVVDSHGVRDVYGKQHLPADERAVFHPGDRDAFVDLEGWRLALSICFDSAHPEHARRCRDAGADAYLVGAFFVEGEERKLADRMGDRARNAGLWVALAQHSGASRGGQACGGSGIWSPDGRPVVQLGREAPALAVAEIPGRSARTATATTSAATGPHEAATPPHRSG